MNNALLIGGSRNGERIETPLWQPLVYIPLMLSFDEVNALAIDEVHSWKIPEEVYVRRNATEFEYRNTVHYKP